MGYIFSLDTIPTTLRKTLLGACGLSFTGQICQKADVYILNTEEIASEFEKIFDS
jgi:hypothetical protein